jgi:hypothetical protein
LIDKWAIGTNAPHKKNPHRSIAQDFLHIYTSTRNDRTDFPHKDLPHLFCINKGCLNFNKIVFIETIGLKEFITKRSLKNDIAENPCGRSARKIFVQKILCGQFLKKLCGAFVPIADK